MLETKLLSIWQSLNGSVVGRWFFSSLLGFFIPYSGNIKPRVEELSPGSCKLYITERRALRNHLKSVHAIALVNAGELASGLAMITTLDPSTRAIVTNIEIEYLKKARGKLLVVGRAESPSIITEKVEVFAHAEIFDEADELVSKVLVTWLLGPRE